MSVVAVIPARGGSKGLPRKNLARVGDRPLLVHSIDHAHAATRVDRVIVSTEDAEIADVARRAGAEVIERPVELATDQATSESALVHALDQLEQTTGTPVLMVFLQATSPLRPPGAIDAAIATLEEQDADSLVSTVPFHGFLWRDRSPKDDSSIGARPIDYDPRRRPRRQERLPTYVENGSIYVFKPWVLRELDCRLGGKIALFPMSKTSAIDIDDADDLTLANALLDAV
ncbi:MAG: acylneuraminate cytidylyltransferase family protein [Acidobacteriota bacterium]